ncbi:DUF2062 domain-containing protein [Exilibacterium tricleocarpae]|uniref:DUF2062 domain-containing protein n=1 Tax=Exilibacterium tricleocarpae TaxID=2591008 RepID=A0A545TVT5_9GAMM|nr:DUF2062 domain-containing protein [Exilibacterium tricleocarpae]TQV81335.1 DUF2062 domain-containing protein [Exilibacterium tricleocarpae]
MARKLLKRWMPDPTNVKKNPSLHFLGDLRHDPNLFHLNRHSVSVAFFVGVFCAFLPIPGQMPIAAIAALLVRCNLPLAVALVWISNPVTIPPIFFATYELGRWILQTPEIQFSIELSWEWVTTKLVKLWQPLLVGSLLSGIFFGTLGYVTMQLFWRWHVVSNWRKRQQMRNDTRENR